MEILLIIFGVLLVALFGLAVFLFLNNSKLGAENSAKGAALKFLQEQKQGLETKIETLGAELKSVEAKLRELREHSIVLEQEKVSLAKEKENLKQWVLDNSDKMHKDFELLANRIFNDAKLKFTEENKEKISAVLKPLNKDLTEFSSKLERMAESNISKQSSLVEQIKYLGDLNKQVSHDANMLASVLKSDNKAAGDWGEMILDKMLESCGFLKGEHYFTQHTLKSEEGEIFRPDVVLKLPQDRVIVVDSKVSLVGFNNYVNATKAEEESAKKAFKNSVASHIKLLSAKKYEDLVDINTPEFVIIFLPVDAALSLITKDLPELLELAYASKIVLASPSTLLAALKTIEFLWRVDKQEKSYAEIVRLGSALYERVYLFLDRFKEVSKKLDDAKSVYIDAEKTLYEGRTSITNTAKKLENLGIKLDSKKIIKSETNEGTKIALD